MKSVVLLMVAIVLFSNCSSKSTEIDLFDGLGTYLSDIASACPNEYYVKLHFIDCSDEPDEVQIDSDEYTRLNEIYDGGEEACVEIYVDYVEGNPTDGYYLDGFINLSTPKDEVFVIKNKCSDGDE